MEKKIKVAVCDDLQEIREYVCNTVNACDDMQVVASFKNGAEAIEAVKALNIDVLLMDVQMEEEKSGIYATEKICDINPEIKIVILTIHDNDDIILDAFLNGAKAYMVKSISAEEICDKIRKVYNNEDFVDPFMMDAIKKEILASRTTKESLLFFTTGFSRLTATEKEILKLLYNGYTRTRIANKKFVSINTVNTHVRHILRKLDFSSTRKLVSFIKSIRLFEEFDL